MRTLTTSGVCLAAATATLPCTLQAQEPSGLRVGAVLEARLGAVDGPAALGQVEAIEVDALERVYVLESDERRVRVFTTSGTLVRTLGRSGKGPGEFQNPVGMTWAPDGTLWIIDPGNARASIYDTTGQYLTDQHFAAGFELAPWPGRFDRYGNFYHYAIRGGRDEFAYVMVKYNTQLHPTDTIFPPTPPERPQVFENRTRRWGTVRARVPFTPRVVWRLGADGRLWWAWTGRHAVYVGAESAHPIAVRKRDPVAVTTAERDEALSGLSRFRQVGGRVDPSRIPDVKPPMRSFFVDDADRIWVMAELANGETGRVLEVYDEHGALRMEIALPVRLSAGPHPVFRRGYIWGIERDEFDVPYLVVLRIGQ